MAIPTHCRPLILLSTVLTLAGCQLAPNQTKPSAPVEVYAEHWLKGQDVSAQQKQANLPGSTLQLQSLSELSVSSLRARPYHSQIAVEKLLSNSATKNDYTKLPEAFLSGDGTWIPSAIGHDNSINPNFRYPYPADSIGTPDNTNGNWTWQKMFGR